MKSILGIYEKYEEHQHKIKLLKFSGISEENISYHEIYTFNQEYMHAIIIDDTSIKDKVNILLLILFKA